MSKLVTVFFVALCGAIAFSACSSGSTAALPTPSPAPSVTPDPKITSATIEVTVLGTPTANIPVAMSTPASKNSPRPGTTIVTEVTGKRGLAKFTNLNPKNDYCWVAILGAGKTSSTCVSWTVWQFTIPIVIGT